MISTKEKANDYILLIILILSIFPSIDIRSYNMPALYLLLPLAGCLLLWVIYKRVHLPNIIRLTVYCFTLIIIEIFLSTIFGSMGSFGKFTFPIDSIQYVARGLTLFAFFIFSYNKKIDANTFIKYFLIIANLAMLIGLLQWVPWPGRELFIKLYPFRDGSLQLSQLNRPLHALRLHGFVGHATSNGGIATFFFIIGFSILRYYKRFKFLSILLMTLAIINIIASQAKAGLLALVFSIFLFFIINIYLTNKKLKSRYTLYFTSGIMAIALIIIVLYRTGNPFVELIVLRWELLFERGGGGRIRQLSYFLSLFENPIHYLFGLSKQVINKSDISFGVEIEPANILISYGALGFILQYALVVILLMYFFKNIKSINNMATKALFISSFVGLLSYQVFSVGYFFFRETRVGLFPWILMGVAVGIYEREKYKSMII